MPGRRGMQMKFDTNYPPIEGWGVSEQKCSGKIFHTGYVSDRAKECPCCGSFPVFEQYVGDVYLDEAGRRQRVVPPKVFVAICPTCELRAKGEGELEEMLAAWNKRKFTKDSLLVHRRMKYVDENGMTELGNSVVREAVEDAVNLIKRKHELLDVLQDPLCTDERRELFYPILKEINKNLGSLQRFCSSGKMLLENDPEVLLSTIRKLVHPKMSPEDRVEIPLDLRKM